MWRGKTYWKLEVRNSRLEISSYEEISNFQFRISNKFLRLRWVLYRQVDPVAPLAPGAEIVPHVRISDQSESQVSVSRPICALAVRNDFLVRRNSTVRVHLLQVGG